MKLYRDERPKIDIRPGRHVTAVGIAKCPNCRADLVGDAVITQARNPNDIELAIPFYPAPPRLRCPLCQGGAADHHPNPPHGPVRRRRNGRPRNRPYPRHHRPVRRLPRPQPPQRRRAAVFDN